MNGDTEFVPNQGTSLSVPHIRWSNGPWFKYSVVFRRVRLNVDKAKRPNLLTMDVLVPIKTHGRDIGARTCEIPMENMLQMF